MIAFCTNSQYLSVSILFIFLHIVPIDVHAQIGTCEPATAGSYLDAGNVRALILNNGSLFWRRSRLDYEVPKGGGASAIFAAGIWVGGLIDEELRIAAARYGSWEFWAGPLDEEGNSSNDCSAYDYIWEIRRSDIVNYYATGVASDNLANWPWHLGAPVVDGDGIPNNYNLAGGDLPELLGDQRLWWIMNDRGNVHESTRSEPIGLEVHASSHAFDHRSFIKNVTFYHYRLINKNTLPLTEAYLGLFADVSLGDFRDDYAGSDSLLHLGFAYNSDNEDDGGEANGLSPPAIGFTILETIVADSDGLDNNRDGAVDEPGEMIGASSVMHYHGGLYTFGDPVFGSDYYNILKARDQNGSPVYVGLNGVEWQDSSYDHIPKVTTKFFFPGDPVTKSFWSEFNIDDRGTPRSPWERRFTTSTGPFTIASWDTVDVRFAIVWSRGKDHLDSVTELKKDVKAVHNGAEFFYTPTMVELQSPAPLSSNQVLGFDQNYPNPFTQSTTLRYSLPQSMQVRLTVYDILGREIKVLVEQVQESGIYTVDFDAEQLPPGVYIARIELDYLKFTKRMVLLR